MIFNYLDYKPYIKFKIRSQPKNGRGVKTSLAKCLGCQTTFISQVLLGNPHFSLEQAMKLNHFFEHTPDESRFFILLIEYARAGSVLLKKFFREQIDEVLKRRNDLSQRLTNIEEIKDEYQSEYYSRWEYAVVHVMLSITEFQNPESIIKQLNLPRSEVLDILTFLVKVGLATYENGKYNIGKNRLHLSRNSMQIRNHHMNWRHRAIYAIERNRAEDLHYSNVFTLSQKDIPAVKEIFIIAIERARKIIRESKEEGTQALTIDYFSI
jgi:uncharacterized protein (TIGR02147 family)